MHTYPLSLDTLLHHKKIFIQLFSRHYPISHNVLEKYKEIWNWEDISSNTQINWSMGLLQQYEKLLHWSYGRVLADNPALPWSVELIKTFINKGNWQWEYLMRQEKIIQNPELLAFCLPRWSSRKVKKSNNFWEITAGYSSIKFIPWGENAENWAHQVVENCPGFRYDWLSEIVKFPWTADFIEKHKKKLDWKLLSYNRGLPWSMDLIKEFEPYWDWNNMAKNIPWNIESLDFFKDKINWKWLSGQDVYTGKNRIVWTQEILESFADKIWWADPFIDHGYWSGYMWESIIDADTFVWTPTLFYKVKSAVEKHFEFLEEEFKKEEVCFEENEYWTYYCNTNNWSAEFFDLLYKKEQTEGINAINWENICTYAKFLWSDAFIEQYFDILKDTHEYHLHSLCSNPYFPWNKYLNKFIPFLDEKTWLLLHQNPKFTPDKEILEKYRNIWKDPDWEHLGKTIHLTMEILEHFEDKWSFSQLSDNLSIPSAMVEKYINKPWDFYSLNRNKIHITWEKIDINKSHPKNWEYLFQNELKIEDYISDEVLENFMEQVN